MPSNGTGEVGVVPDMSINVGRKSVKSIRLLFMLLGAIFPFQFAIKGTWVPASVVWPLSPLIEIPLKLEVTSRSVPLSPTKSISVFSQRGHGSVP